VIIIHWFTRAAIYIKLIVNNAYDENLTMWILTGLQMVPLMKNSWAI
jgi:hypothetical protein